MKVKTVHLFNYWNNQSSPVTAITCIAPHETLTTCFPISFSTIFGCMKVNYHLFLILPDLHSNSLQRWESAQIATALNSRRQRHARAFSLQFNSTMAKSLAVSCCLYALSGTVNSGNKIAFTDLSTTAFFWHRKIPP